MKQRKIHLSLAFPEYEYRILSGKAKKAGISKARFIRQAIAGKEVNVAPTAEVPTLIMEVRRVGNVLDQILKTAESKGIWDTEAGL